MFDNPLTGTPFSYLGMPPQVIFLDAAGTLITLCEPVGVTYARVAATHGVVVDAVAIGRAFRSSWKALPPPVHPSPPPDDDRGWWRALVEHAFALVLGQSVPAQVMGPLFSDLYDFFARPAAWAVYEDVRPALDRLKPHFRLLVLSNFDQRLRQILQGHGLLGYFEDVIISSEIGASKPHPRIFEAALLRAGVDAASCLHVGDDEKADAAGAEGQGIPHFLVRRPGAGLEELAEKLLSG